MFILFVKFSRLYINARPYVYSSSCHILQALCLFPVLCLFQTQWYLKCKKKKWNFNSNWVTSYILVSPFEKLMHWHDCKISKTLHCALQFYVVVSVKSKDIYNSFCCTSVGQCNSILTPLPFKLPKTLFTLAKNEITYPKMWEEK